jgi:hypothetical protein
VTTAPEGQYSCACADNVIDNSHIDINPEAIKSAIIGGFVLYSFITFEFIAAIAVPRKDTLASVYGKCNVLSALELYNRILYSI